MCIVSGVMPRFMLLVMTYIHLVVAVMNKNLARFLINI